MTDQKQSPVPRDELLHMVTDITAAYVGNNTVATDQVPEVITAVYQTLAHLGQGDQDPATPPTPAVPIRRSITPDYIVCLEDGKKLKMLKRYLRSRYDLSPEEYRRKWGLPPDYPMVAPNYAAQRSAFAKKIGLGRKKKR